MTRREFISLLGGAAAAWPLAAQAQQPGRMRRVGVLMAFDENDPEAKAYLSGFTQGLAELGWTDGRNLRMDVRWAAGRPNADVRERVARPATRRHSRAWNSSDRCIPAGDADDPDCICGCFRPGRRWLR